MIKMYSLVQFTHVITYVNFNYTHAFAFSV